MRWIGLVLLGACTPGAADEWFAEDGTAFLSDQPYWDFPERARPMRDARVRLTPAGSELPLGFWPNREVTEVVVVDEGEQVRATWSNADAQLLLWFERSTLHEVSVSDFAVDLGEGSSVGWPAGTPLEALDVAERQSLVRTTLRDWEVEAWVDGEPVGEVWRQDERERQPDNEEDIWVSEPVLDAPGGHPFAWPLHDEVAMEVSGPPVDGYLPVLWTERGEVVRGWVVDQERPLGFDPFAFRCGGIVFGFGSEEGVANVPAGTPLYDVADGVVVGQTRRDVAVSFDASGWGALPVNTPWGRGRVVVWEGDALAW